MTSGLFAIAFAYDVSAGYVTLRICMVRTIRHEETPSLLQERGADSISKTIEKPAGLKIYKISIVSFPVYYACRQPEFWTTYSPV